MQVTVTVGMYVTTAVPALDDVDEPATFQRLFNRWERLTSQVVQLIPYLVPSDVGIVNGGVAVDEGYNLIVLFITSHVDSTSSLDEFFETQSTHDF